MYNLFTDRIRWTSKINIVLPNVITIALNQMLNDRVLFTLCINTTHRVHTSPTHDMMLIQHSAKFTLF